MERVLLFCVFVSCICCYSAFIPPPSFRVRRAAKELNSKWNSTNEDKLKRDLMLNYDKFTRPRQHDNATTVTFDPTINHVELDEARSILIVHCWVKMTWTDDKLKWDSNDYGGLTILRLADHEIWQPDLLPYNSASGSSVDIFGNTHAMVTSDGGVIWVPPAILKVFCELDLRKWPFDTQICPVKVGSWVYSGQEINLKFIAEKPDFSNLVSNAEWQFISVNRERNLVHYECCTEPYIDLVFKITVSRNSPTYKALIITPITAIVLMTLATFWLPAGSNEKFILGGGTALIISIFIVFFTQKLAVMAGHTPYIVSFYTSSLYLVAFSVVISAVVNNLANNPRSTPIPWIIKSHLKGRLGRILFLEDDDSQNLSYQRSLPKSSGDEDTADNRPVFAEEGSDLPEGQRGNRIGALGDWRLLATALDRIAFLFYCLLFCIFALAYLT